MPKRVSEAALQKLEEAINRHPKGIGVAALESELSHAISRRSLQRHLTLLVDAGRLERKGVGRATIYLPQQAEPVRKLQRPGVDATFVTPDGVVTIPLSAVANDTLDYVSRPPAERAPVGYNGEFLDDYEPDRSAYLPDDLKAHLHKIGRPIVAERAAGTFARDILSRLLIDLSWSSSRLEGNTYTRLDTQRLIEFGQAAEGKDASETQMILNHKDAIELIVDGSEELGMNRYTLLNLHALLSENLLADPEAIGRLRRRPVEIGQSVYTPLGVPQVVEEYFDLILEKAHTISDPFEQGFFVMVHIPYLQPFEDVNKRVSRLGANIPLIRNDLCPLSFIDVPEKAYIAGTMGIYELNRIELLRDVFTWTYERSCRRYVVIRDTLVEPDAFRMKHRGALTGVINGIVRNGELPTTETVRTRAVGIVDPRDLEKFVEMTELELCRLHEGNIARYRIGLTQYRDWRAGQSADERSPTR